MPTFNSTRAANTRGVSAGTCPHCGALRKEMRDPRDGPKCARCRKAAECRIPRLIAMRTRGRWN